MLCACVYATHWEIQCRKKESPQPWETFWVRRMLSELGSAGQAELAGRLVGISHVTKMGMFVGQKKYIYKGEEKQQIWYFSDKVWNLKLDVFLDWRNGQGPGPGGFCLDKELRHYPVARRKPLISSSINIRFAF